jgi:hypothetical protein
MSPRFVFLANLPPILLSLFALLFLRGIVGQPPLQCIFFGTRTIIDFLDLCTFFLGLDYSQLVMVIRLGHPRTLPRGLPTTSLLTSIPISLVSLLSTHSISIIKHLANISLLLLGNKLSQCTKILDVMTFTVRTRCQIFIPRRLFVWSRQSNESLTSHHFRPMVSSTFR